MRLPLIRTVTHHSVDMRREAAKPMESDANNVNRLGVPANPWESGNDVNASIEPALWTLYVSAARQRNV